MPITQLLQAVSTGCDEAMDELMNAVQHDLHDMAVHQMQRMFGPKLGGITLEPAALVNETYLRLIQQEARFDNRRHFFAIVTKIMLRVLIDYQRQRMAAKRGGNKKNHTNGVTLSLVPAGGQSNAASNRVGLEEFEIVLDALEQVDSRKADIVRMRVIWSMTHDQIAEATGVSRSTVERDWLFAKSWILRELDRIREG